MSELEDELVKQIRLAGLPIPTREYKFALPWRRWALDIAFVEDRIAIEVDGGSWVSGAHSSGQGSENDHVKAAVALLLGWAIFRVNNHMVLDGRALYLIKAALGLGHDIRDAAYYLATTRCSACDLTGTRRRQKQRQKAKEKSSED